jgi:hypothetical protein
LEIAAFDDVAAYKHRSKPRLNISNPHTPPQHGCCKMANNSARVLTPLAGRKLQIGKADQILDWTAMLMKLGVTFSGYTGPNACHSVRLLRRKCHCLRIVVSVFIVSCIVCRSPQGSNSKHVIICCGLCLCAPISCWCQILFHASYIYNQGCDATYFGDVEQGAFGANEKDPFDIVCLVKPRMSAKRLSQAPFVVLPWKPLLEDKLLSTLQPTGPCFEMLSTDTRRHVRACFVTRHRCILHMLPSW